MSDSLQPYPAYRPSGVDWLGDVPAPWDVPSSLKISYEISFTRYFYKPQPLRPLDEIRADIMTLDRELKACCERSSRFRSACSLSCTLQAKHHDTGLSRSTPAH